MSKKNIDNLLKFLDDIDNKLFKDVKNLDDVDHKILKKFKWDRGIDRISKNYRKNCSANEIRFWSYFTKVLFL